MSYRNCFEDVNVHRKMDLCVKFGQMMILRHLLDHARIMRHQDTPYAAVSGPISILTAASGNLDLNIKYSYNLIEE